MHRPLRRTSAALAAVALTTGLAAAPSAFAADPHHPANVAAPGPEHYVALGDSFVSGPGIPRQLDGCGRSDQNFVRLVARDLQIASFTDASCGAAVTANYWNPQTLGGFTNPAQLDALSRDTSLVTLGTMGGNDVGLVSLATTCILRGCASLDPQPFIAAIEALVPVYRDVIEDVRRRSPRADIVAVGYGTYVPREPCAALGNAEAADLVFLQGMIDRLSDTIGRVADQEGASFVDMRTIEGWQEHSACAEPAEQWIRGLDGYGDGIALHPSTAGMQQMAAKTLETVRPLVTARRVSERRVAEAARTVRLRAVCHGPRRDQRVTVRTTGGRGLVVAAHFRVGHHWVGSDLRAPFAVTRSVRSLEHHHARGPVRAKVLLRHGKAVRAATVTASPPRCLS